MLGSKIEVGSCISVPMIMGYCLGLPWYLYLTFQRDDLAGWVHNGAVGTDGAADRVGRVCHVDDDHLGRLAHLLPHADVLVGLHGEGVEPDVRSVDTNIGEL